MMDIDLGLVGGLMSEDEKDAKWQQIRDLQPGESVELTTPDGRLAMKVYAPPDDTAEQPRPRMDHKPNTDYFD